LKIKEELDALVSFSRVYYSRMWMYATAGNLSILDPESGVIWITASGKDKGKLENTDFLGVFAKPENR